LTFLRYNIILKSIRLQAVVKELKRKTNNEDEKRKGFIKDEDF